MKIFEEDLQKNAVIMPQSAKTYKEFHYDVELLKEYFIRKEIRRIAVVTEKSYESYCILWAAYYAGATFCVLNPDLSNERIEDCLQLFDPQLTIAESSMLGNHSDYLSFDQVYAEAVNSKLTYEKLQEPQCNNVLYVLFTSGTTGEPKGVAVLRKAIEEVIEWAKENIPIGSADIVGQYCNLSFDMGLCDVFLAFSAGAAVVPITGINKLTPGRLVKKYAISYIYAVPSIVDIFMKHKDYEKGNLGTLRLVGFGGAPLYQKHMEYISKHNDAAIVFNTYGPTETTLFTSCVVFNVKDYETITNQSVCLGNAISGVIYEIDDDSTGFGELVVKGNHCLAGYLNKDNRIDYFNAVSKGYFATGDLVQIINNCMYFVSRKDHQVKIRGNRIELDSIDSKLSLLGIASVSMVIDEKFVIFYSGDISRTMMLDTLKSFLPYNCVPDQFIHLDSIPTNRNGKVDREKLKEHILQRS